MSSEHPSNLSLGEMSGEELDKKHALLVRRWQIARQMGMDQQVLIQLDMLLNSIENEKERRMTVDQQYSGVIMETDPIQMVPNPYIGKK
jgi:hypothetical protein